MVLRKTTNDCWLLKSKIGAWWRNESLQMRNLTSWNWQSLIRKRVRGCKVINNNNAGHVGLVRKDFLSIRNWGFEVRSCFSQAEEHASDWVGWD